MLINKKLHFVEETLNNKLPLLKKQMWVGQKKTSRKNAAKSIKKVSAASVVRGDKFLIIILFKRFVKQNFIKLLLIVGHHIFV